MKYCRWALRCVALFIGIWFTGSVVIASLHTHKHFTTPTVTETSPNDDCFLCELTDLGGGSPVTNEHIRLTTPKSAPFYLDIPAYRDYISVESVLKRPTRGPPQTLTSTHCQCPDHHELFGASRSNVSSGGYLCIVHLHLSNYS
jgi:hypothetical protein